MSDHDRHLATRAGIVVGALVLIGLAALAINGGTQGLDAFARYAFVDRTWVTAGALGATAVSVGIGVRRLAASRHPGDCDPTAEHLRNGWRWIDWGLGVPIALLLVWWALSSGSADF